MKINFTKTAAHFFIAVAFMLNVSNVIQAQNITTYAGNGTATYTGNGGQATAAGLNQSTGVAIDATGNIYIADSQNSVIRKVDAATGIITTVAGNGTNGYNGDGIPATNAKFSDPWGVAVDDSGNIYVADYGNHAIRKVTAATGLISTVAGTPGVGTRQSGALGGDGGPATAGHLAYPIGLCLDDSANIYIADQYDFCIRKVTVKTGIITTIAGILSGSGGFSGNGGQATAAQLYFPSGLVVDDSGNVYIADQWNNEIRVVSQKTGIISDFAGNGFGAPGLYSGAYAGDGGQATAAELNYATGVGKDDSGNIYIADWSNEVIRKVAIKTGIITTVAGDNALGAGYSGDGGPATTAKLFNPSGVVVDGCGDIYIADYANNRIREVNVASDTIKVTPLTSSICSGNSDTLRATGGSGYKWSPSAGLSDTTGSIVIANPTITTTYTLTGNAGCGGSVSTSLSVIVTVTSSPSVSITPLSPVVCNGQSITLKASGGTSYQWVGTANTTDSLVINPTKDTTYELIVSNGTCSKDTIINVKAGNAPPLDIEPQGYALCFGSSVSLYVAGGGASFTWSPATGLASTTGDTVLASPTITITYTVTGTDSLGCSATGTDEVDVIPAPNKPAITKSGDVLTSSATQGNQWYINDTIINGATNQNYIISASGCFSVSTINPANGCTATSDTLCTTPTGINQLTSIRNQLSIYPNPTSGFVYLTVNSSVQNVKDWNLEVTDVLGRIVLKSLSLGYNNEVDLSGFSDGVYFITILNKTQQAVFPIIKQN